MLRSQLVLRWGLAVIIVGQAVGGLLAQDEAKQAQPTAAPAQAPREGDPQPVEMQQILPRFRGEDRELLERRIQSGAVAPDKADQKTLVAIETASLVSVYYGANPNPRFLPIKAVLVNLTPDAVTIKRDEVQLVVDGTAQSPKDAPQQFQFHSFQVGQQGFSLKSAQMPAEISVPPGQAVTAWMLFPEIPSGNQIPPMTLKIKAGERTVTIDLNAWSRDQLAIQVERLGPRRALGLVSIAGELNALSVGALVDELDRLAGERIVRIVVSFRDGARIWDYGLHNWLQQSAALAGRGQQMGENQFPGIPTALRELHLVSLPSPGSQPQPSTTAKPPEQVSPLILFGAGGAAGASRLHASEADAVIAALRSACEILPRDELARSIVSQNRLERAAALAAGAGRLSADKLPIILEATRDADVVVQQAAVAALAHFGEPAAIARLVELARQNVEPQSSTAVASLAGSRYSAAHAALLELLKSEPPEVKKLIVRMLAQFPRPIWSEAIYEFVQDGRAGLNIEALNALVQVGHPRLVGVLTDALQGKDEALQQQALAVLVARSDQESEDIALGFTLAALHEKEPTPTMLALLNRVKERRALPLLLERFPASQNKQALIQTLALIGDQETSQFLVDKYSMLQNHEKGEVIRALARLDKPRFRELAGQALASGDGSVVSYAIQGLQEDGGPEAIRLMIDVLAKAENANSWQQLMYALANTGSPQARAALIKARDSGNQDKRNVAVNALQNMRFRSPGFQNYSQAQAQAREQKWKEAIEQFSASIQMDPGFSDSYAERGIAYLHLEKYEEAGKDFSKAFELDPYNSLALTGECLVLILGSGKPDAAVKRLEEHRGKYPNNAIFQYNAACVYGRAVEHTARQDASADRDAKLAQFRQAALADLKKSLELGFSDMELLKKDPDLKPLHDTPEFQELLKGRPVPAEGAALNGPRGAARAVQLRVNVR